MNERIKELVDQCSAYSDMHQGIWFDKEKFAELIVKECLGIVEKRHEQAIDDGWDADSAMCSVRGDIERHFGVEE